MRSLATGQQQNTRSIGGPSPIRGILAESLYGAEGPIGLHGAIWLYNLLPGEYGCRVRPGSKEFAINIPDTSGPQGEIRTLMYFNSVVAGGGNDKYFAATDEGIFDITAGGIGPHVKVVDWATDGVYGAGDRAGWCSYINYTNVAGNHYLLVCDEKNGYFIYDGALDTWARGTFTGSPKPLAEDLVQITEWQARIWFVERDTARAWFLDPLALTGDIAPFDVGNRFLKGGHLVQNTTWTLDDGAGMDDKFVMISSSGDILVFVGIDPTTAADMTLVGRWQVGIVPEGRRVMSNWGGDVAIISGLGVTKLSTLLGGMATLNEDSYATKNITRYFRREVAKTANEDGWSMELIPGGDAAVFSVPDDPNNPAAEPIQFVYVITIDAWAILRGWDMNCQERHNDGYFFGTRDGRVLQVIGEVDNVRLAPDPFQGNWVFEGAEVATDPPAGQWNYETSSGITTLRLNYTDNDTNDWETEILTLLAGTRIDITDNVDADKSITFQLTSKFNDAGTSASAKVLKVSTGANGEPVATDTTTVNVIPYIESAAIEFSLLTHYDALGNPATWKRPQFIRPAWIGSTQPVYSLQVRYDFDLTEVQTAPPYLEYDLGVWDSGIWDTSDWAGVAQRYFETIGVNGQGRHIAIALKGQSTTDLSLVGYDIMYDEGGML